MVLMVAGPETNLINSLRKKQQADMNEEPQPETSEPTIHLDQFLKTCGVATGGQAKRMIQGGEILVNGEIETRRRRQLRVGDEVALDDTVYVVALGEA